MSESFLAQVVWCEGADAPWINWQCNLCAGEFKAGTANYLAFGDLYICQQCGDAHANIQEKTE